MPAKTIKNLRMPSASHWDATANAHTYTLYFTVVLGQVGYKQNKKLQ